MKLAAVQLGRKSRRRHIADTEEDLNEGEVTGTRFAFASREKVCTRGA